jgi:N-acetylneuraminic acid mutarotase
MKKLFLVVMVLALFFGCKKSATNLGNWIKSSAFEGVPRGSAASFVLANKVYLGTGFNNSQDIEYLKDFWMYDPAQDFWTKLTDFPGEPRKDAVAFTVNGKGYLGLGYNGTIELNDFWEFDPATNAWTRKADFMGTARYGAVAFSLGNLGYVGTGFDINLSDTRDFYSYDPITNQWTQIHSMGGSKREYATAFTYNGKAYVTTGINNGVNQNDLWVFDPTTGDWTEKAKLDFNTAWTITRSHASSFVLGNYAYISVGYNSGVRKDTWEYDFAGDTWTKKTDFEGSARQDAIGYVVNGRAFIATGASGSYYFDDIWELKPFDAYNSLD